MRLSVINSSNKAVDGDCNERMVLRRTILLGTFLLLRRRRRRSVFVRERRKVKSMTIMKINDIN
jgi:hypothetical protein